jgi:predicted RNase H-like HicB family nuclease
MRLKLADMSEVAFFTGVFVKIDDYYVAYAEEEPGAITEGNTLEEAQNNLVDAFIQLQIARRKHQTPEEASKRETSERKAAAYEAELESSGGEIIRIPHISVDVPSVEHWRSWLRYV